MRRTSALAIALVASLGVGTAVVAPGTAVGTATTGTTHTVATKGRDSVRFATYNASLNRNAAGQLVADLSTRTNAQANAVAEVIQRERPDVLLVNEFDYVPGHQAANLFRSNYLEVGHNGAAPVHYPYVYVAPSNTGIPTGFDLNNDGQIAGGDDAFGFGAFEGQYGMVVYSRYPIDTRHARTFQLFKWKDMPGALLPDDAATPAPADWYSPAELERTAAVEQVALGSADPDRAPHRPLPRFAPDSADRSTGSRTAMGSGTTTRSGSGRTTCSPADRRRTSMTTRAGAAVCSRAVRSSSRPT